MRRILLFTLVAAIAGTTNLLAQQTYHLAEANSSVTVTGTSTLHDWEMTAKSVTANMTVDKNGSSINKISNVYFAAKSDNIVGESSIMNGKAQDALKAEKYPMITFRMESVNSLVSNGGKLTGSLTGDVTIAGVSRNISLPFEGTVAGNTIKVTGSKSLKMSDFNVTPPTAMLGTLKTGDEIKINFKLEFTD